MVMNVSLEMESMLLTLFLLSCSRSRLGKLSVMIWMLVSLLSASYMFFI